MRLLRWVSVALWILLVTFTGAAIMYGRAYGAPAPTPFDPKGLNICDGKLCLFQLTPGVTRWSDGKQVLATSIVRDEGDHFHGQINNLAIRVQMDSTGLQISRVDVQGSGSGQSPISVRFSQIVQQFGLPCYIVNILPGNRGIVLAYPSFQITILAQDNHVSLDSPVDGFTLTDGNNLNIENTACSAIMSGLPWRGFASLPLYQTLIMNQGGDWLYR